METDPHSEVGGPRPRLVLRRFLVPPGSVALVFSLGISGVSAYAFLILAARALAPADYSSLAAFWTLAFFVGPGIYVAIDQEMARAVSARLALRRSTRPVVVRVAQVGVVLTLLLLAVGAATSPYLLGRAFDHQLLLLTGFLLILPGYCLLSAFVGTQNAFGQLRVSAVVVAGEGVFRLLGCAVLAIVGIRMAGPYGLAVGAAPFAAALVGWRASHVRLTPGPAEPWRPVATAVGLLIGGTVLNQFLLVIGPFVVKVLADSTQQAVAGRFLNAISLTRIPLFLFNAVIPVLLPRFTRLVAAGRWGELNRLLVRITVVLSVVFGAATLVSGFVGPALLRFLYGPRYGLAGGTVALLAVAAGLYCVATVLSLALIATRSYLATTISWGLGVGAMLATIALASPFGLVGRVTWGYLLGCVVSTVSMAAFACFGRSTRIPAGQVLS